MSRSRVVVPISDRMQLTDGDWIELKRDLNTGEQKLLEAAGCKPPIRTPEGDVLTPIDWGVYEIERAFIFLTEWSFRDPNDMPLKLSIAAIKSLDPATFDEINNAIFAHVKQRLEAKKAEREAKMGTPPTAIEPVSGQTST